MPHVQGGSISIVCYLLLYRGSAWLRPLASDPHTEMDGTRVSGTSVGQQATQMAAGRV